jgi:hypothetical protein
LRQATNSAPFTQCQRLLRPTLEVSLRARARTGEDSQRVRNRSGSIVRGILVAVSIPLAVERFQALRRFWSRNESIATGQVGEAFSHGRRGGRRQECAHRAGGEIGLLQDTGLRRGFGWLARWG